MRALWALDPRVAHLNHGSYGAVPLPVMEHQDALRAEVEANPDRFYSRELAPRMLEARHAAAAFLGADDEGVAFVPNATTGVACALSALDLAPGDEIVLTDHVYPGVRNTVDEVCRRTAASVVEAPVALTDDALEAVLAATGPRTRAAIVEHVTSPTALVFPVERIVEALRERGIVTIVDAAHVPGMLPVDLSSLAPDVWTGNFHKWAGAPRGAAALYVHPRLRDRVRPMVGSLLFGGDWPSAFDWTGTDDYTPYLCVPKALDVLGAIGWDTLRAHNAELAMAGSKIFADALGTRLAVRPPDRCGISMGLVELPARVGVATTAQARHLAARIASDAGAEVAVTLWRGRGWIRLSAQAYNSLEEYERAGAAIRSVLG